MSKPWPKVSLGELLRLERRKVKVEPERLYQEIGIYCFGRGIFRKLPRTGLEVGDKDLSTTSFTHASFGSCRFDLGVDFLHRHRNAHSA